MSPNGPAIVRPNDATVNAAVVDNLVEASRLCVICAPDPNLVDTP